MKIESDDDEEAVEDGDCSIEGEFCLFSVHMMRCTAYIHYTLHVNSMLVPFPPVVHLFHHVAKYFPLYLKNHRLRIQMVVFIW